MIIACAKIYTFISQGLWLPKIHICLLLLRAVWVFTLLLIDAIFPFVSIVVASSETVCVRCCCTVS